MRYLYHHYTMSPGSPCKNILPPQEFPQEFPHSLPSVFFAEYISPKLAHKVQRILGFGPDFQYVNTQLEETFTSPFHFSLYLEHNTPHLHFSHYPNGNETCKRKIDSSFNKFALKYTKRTCVFSQSIKVTYW